MQPSILFLVDDLARLGGTETHLFELSRRLPAQGFRPIVCNLAGDQPVLRQIAEAGVETWPRAIPRLYMPAGRAVVREVVRAARAENVHAVHTFHFKSDWMGAMMARVLGCPLLSSRRDMGFTLTPLRRLVYRFINRRMDAVIAPSLAVKEMVAREQGVPAERIHVVYNGLERARFENMPDRGEARAWLGLPQEGAVIGMVANLRPIKDHPTLLRAFGAVAAGHSDARLVLVGQGDEEANLRARASELGILDRVVFAGARKDIPRALAALDIFVLSTHTEGMSNAILEAMAAGLPVIATDVGGNPECVADGETGYLVAHEDAGALAERLSRLLDDPGLSRRLGQAGRACVAETFDVEAMVRHTADLYRMLAPNRKETADAYV